MATMKGRINWGQGDSLEAGPGQECVSFFPPPLFSSSHIDFSKHVQNGISNLPSYPARILVHAQFSSSQFMVMSFLQLQQARGLQNLTSPLFRSQLHSSKFCLLYLLIVSRTYPLQTSFLCCLDYWETHLTEKLPQLSRSQSPCCLNYRLKEILNNPIY